MESLKNIIFTTVAALIIVSCGGTEEEEVFEVDLDLGLEDISFDDMKPAEWSETSSVTAPVHSGTCITSNYGPRDGGFHSGIDLRTRHDDSRAVYAVADGKVVEGEEGSGHAGVFIKIYHQEFDKYSIYAHLSVRYVSPGRKVKKGDIIGIAGETGRTSGEHLHFGIKDKNNSALNPRKWLKQNLVFISECSKMR
ncbi:MAG TPA: M23 family metallopeptidase [bacterium]|nr:M23 family metallopeptidase [bacterium]